MKPDVTVSCSKTGNLVTDEEFTGEIATIQGVSGFRVYRCHCGAKVPTSPANDGTPVFGWHEQPEDTEHMPTSELLDTAVSMLGDAIQMLGEGYHRLGVVPAESGQSPLGHIKALKRLIENERTV